MATPNYSYEKRQRELAKKRKKEEKAMRKTSGTGDASMLATREMPEPLPDEGPAEALPGTPPAVV